MKCNVGKTDRVLRFIPGLVLIAFGIVRQSGGGSDCCRS